MPTLIFSFLLQISITLGIGVDSHTILDGEYLFSAPFHNWNARPLDCHRNDFWASIYRPKPGNTIPGECGDNPLLLGNECELSGQCNQEIDLVAAGMHDVLGHSGKLYCCGSYYDNTGWWYTLKCFGFLLFANRVISPFGRVTLACLCVAGFSPRYPYVAPLENVSRCT